MTVLAAGSTAWALAGVVASGPASATGPILYAAPNALGTGSCSDPADACDLGTALGLAVPGDDIELVTSGIEGQSSTYYEGGFTISTAGTSLSDRLTIEPAPGVTDPILDGGSSAPVLTVTIDAIVTLDGLTIQNGSNDFGAGLANNDGGRVTVLDSTFVHNLASEDGGAIDNADALAGSGSGVVGISGSTFTGNSARLNGGAVDSGDRFGATGGLLVNNSVFAQNSAYDGGAIDNGDQDATGAAIIFGSFFSANHGTFGGAIGNAVGTGGNGGVLVATSTLSANSSAGYGGAIANGLDRGLGTAIIAFSTLAGNTSAFFGGAIDNGDLNGTGILQVLPSTFVGNTSSDDDAGTIDNGQNSGTGQTTIGASVLDSSCERGSAPSSWTDQGYNVDADATCTTGATGDATDPNLPQLFGALTDNGGSTPTIALGASNPAVTRIPASGTSFCPVSQDQRGVASAANEPCDAGAIQLANQAITFTSTPLSPALVGGTYTPSATASSSLPVSLSTDPSSASTCTLAGGVVTFLAPGTCVVLAAQAGNPNWTAAPTASQAVKVGSPTPSGGACLAAARGQKGYWICGPDGTISAFGGAASFGSMANRSINEPVVGMASTPAGGGYWLVASDGGVFAFGDAPYEGSMGGRPLNAPIVAIAGTPDGGGYWLVGSDGGIFAFGDASYNGSMAGRALNQPIVGAAPTPDGGGYWLVASDGGLFSFGDAAFFGSLGNLVLNRPIVGVVSTPDGLGYWFVAADGGVFAEGDAGYYGSTGGMPGVAPVIGLIASATGNGYRIIDGLGNATSFGS